MAISRATSRLPDAHRLRPVALEDLAARLAGRPEEAWDWIERLQATQGAARRNAPRQCGVVATPIDIAQQMAEALLPRNPTAATLRVLDAGCGGGRLLTAVLRTAAARGLRVDCHGIDIDPGAARWAQALEPLVRIAAGASLGKWEVRRADFVHEPDAAVAFDAVIANPPYVAMRSLDVATRTRLGREARAAGDLAAWFVHRLLDSLRPGGRLCVIVPNKLLAAKYAAPLRARLVDETCIEAIWDLSGARVFPGHGSYPVVLVLRRGAMPAAHRVAVRDAAGTPRARWSQRALRRLPDTLFPLGLSPQLLTLALRLYDGPRLGDVSRVECGIAVSGFGRAVGHGSDRILRSGDVQAFRLRAATAFDPAGAGIPAHRLARLQVPKVMVPGMFRRLCAAWDGRGILVGRVYFMRLEGESPAARERRRVLLLALLNSRLYALLYAGLFAAVAQSGGWLRANGPYLESLPWPGSTPGPELAAVVRKLEAARGRGSRERLDHLVEDLFGLAAADRLELQRLAGGLAAADQAPDCVRGSTPSNPPGTPS